MENKYLDLRKELDSLGYFQSFLPECVPLVERLLNDLKITTISLEKYMKLAERAMEERDTLELGAEPYKCDNAKLIKECNELHLAFIQFKEQHEKVQKDLKRQLRLLENEKIEWEAEKLNLKKKIKNLEVELVEQGKVIKRKQTQFSNQRGSPEKQKFKINSSLACADEKICHLTKEIKKLKDEKLDLLESNDLNLKQIANRDKEIRRLNDLLQGGRTAKAVNKDYCHKDTENNLSMLQDQLASLRKEKLCLQNNLKEALAKQHEAMRRALHLAERNKQLEKELKDIDQIALTVEAECNNTVKSKSEKIGRLQDRLNEFLVIIQSLERENKKLLLEKQQPGAEIELGCSQILDNGNIDQILDEKEKLEEKVKTFNRIETDLNNEIDRLHQKEGEQRRKIAELEGELTKIISEKKSDFSQTSNNILQRDSFVQKESTEDKAISTLKGNRSTLSERVQTSPKRSRSVSKRKDSLKKSIPAKRSRSRKHSKRSSIIVPKNTPTNAGEAFFLYADKCCCEAGSCIKHFKDLLDKEIDYRQTQTSQALESLVAEKNYYMQEYHKLLENMKHDSKPKVNELLQKVEEKEKLISSLSNENRVLSQERESLKKNVETLQKMDSNFSEPCMNTNCKRQSREFKLIREDLNRLEEENQELRKRVQVLSDQTSVDTDRAKKVLENMEEHIVKLENERRELVINENNLKAKIRQLEDQCNSYNEQLRSTKNELNLQNASYNQLKILHENTDRSVNVLQEKLIESESKLANMQLSLRNNSRDSVSHEKEVQSLHSDIDVLKRQINQMDKEKDDCLMQLDQKAEQIACLKDELKNKQARIHILEDQASEYKRRMGEYESKWCNKDEEAKSYREESSALLKDLEREKNLKQMALQECRRVQDNLASVTCQLKHTQHELEISQRQVEDLKRQLQIYVAEIKRTEDLITQKELERNELLDQFRSLSQEANALENNNHSLENENSHNKVQLSVALDHASDLEKQLETKDCLIRSYEKQINELSSEVANLEMKVQHIQGKNSILEEDLTQIRDLCSRLSKEKDDLRLKLLNKTDDSCSANKNLDKFIEENEVLKMKLNKERNSLEGMEKLLNESRQEVIEQRLINEELHKDVNRLKRKIEELQDRLVTANEQLDIYQEKALDYSQQNKQLRREIANNRFSRAHDDESKRTIEVSYPTHPKFPSNGQASTQEKKKMSLLKNEEKCNANSIKSPKSSRKKSLERNNKKGKNSKIDQKNISSEPVGCSPDCQFVNSNRDSSPISKISGKYLEETGFQGSP